MVNSSSGVWDYSPAPQRRGIPSVYVKVAAGAVAAVLVLVLAAVEIRRPPAIERLLILSVSQTQQEVALPAPPVQFVTESEELSARGGGFAVMVGSAGATGKTVGDPIPLRVNTDGTSDPHGQQESDVPTRNKAITRRLAAAWAALIANPPVDNGRSFVDQLATVASIAHGHKDVEAWVLTFGLSTNAPEDDRLLMATDPTPAAASLPSAAVPALADVSLHLILVSAAGNQPALSAQTAAWRLRYDTAVLSRTHADLLDITESTTAGKGWPAAPVAAPISNILLHTPQIRKPKKTGRTATPLAPHPMAIDTAAAFEPDLADLLETKAQLDQQLAGFVTDQKAFGTRFGVTVIGSCARYGPHDTAVVLSRQRAAVIAAELRRLGVNVTKVDGFGYDNPPYPGDPTSPRNRIVTISPHLSPTSH